QNKGYEASEKADLHELVTNIATEAVDGPSTITLTAAGTNPDKVTITSDLDSVGTVVGLSPSNHLGANSATTITVGSDYCISVQNTHSGTKPWHMSVSGPSQTLAAGDCP
ncbi:MAG: prepilin-type cleavage/methylation domain-containing protein, partial [Acidothermus sp.]|nr:prepilin-type cleavage/methylation domain-containing protein [Acidothermus sp.]